MDCGSGMVGQVETLHGYMLPFAALQKGHEALQYQRRQDGAEEARGADRLGACLARD
jgi:hypothetical protein